MGKMNITPIDEVNWGLYMWQMPDESVIMDEDGNHLCIPSLKGDIVQIKKLKRAAQEYGVNEGKPIFFAGHRQITDEELEEQKKRSELGLVPDPQDLPAMMEFIKEQKDMGIA